MKYIYVYSINTPVIKRSPAGSPAGTSRVYLHASSGCGKERNHNKEKIWLVVLDILKRDAFNRFTSKTTRLWVEIQANCLPRRLRSCKRPHIVRNHLFKLARFEFVVSLFVLSWRNASVFLPFLRVLF
jgi:hypothetical protein